MNQVVIEKTNNIYAVVGLGSVSDRHRANLKSIFPASQVACLSSSGRSINKMPSECDILSKSLAELISLRPNFVIIASPATFHAQHAIPFIENNIPVLIEKPIAANTKDAQKIADSAKKYKTPVAVAYCLRYKPFINEIKDYLDQKIIGKLITVDITSGSYLPDWRPYKNYLKSVSASEDLGGGALLELSHEIDYANLLLKQMHLQSATIRNSQTLNIEVEDSADLTFELAEGGHCNIHLDFLQKPSIRNAHFYGSSGKILWDLQNNNIDIVSSYVNKNMTIEGWDSNEMYIEMLEDFAMNFITQQENKLCTALEALSVLEFIEKAKQSNNRYNNE